ncbi:MAG: S41 family peptidase [Planctomycetota bacterium]|nr:S41 family peptidase [Planctomycetota bacterium]
MSRKEWIPSLVSTAIFMVAALAIVMIASEIRQRKPLIRDVSEVARQIEERYLFGVDDDELRYAALEGMVDALDPYSEFYPPDQAREINEENDGKFGGLGIRVRKIKGEPIYVESTLEGQPAFNAGVRAGDWITAVDGFTTEQLKRSEILRLLKGEVGSSVRLTIHRKGVEASLEIDVVRGEIQILSVVGAELIDPQARIGYLRMIQFQVNSPAEFDDAIDELEARGMQSLIVDLRTNPGGVLTASLRIAGRFLPLDAPLLKTVSRDKTEEEYEVENEPTLPRIPLVVLVNEFSASASEIVAGAIQDHQRGILVGTRTFGKGSVQTLIPIGKEEALLKLTTAKYQTPSGRQIHREPGAGEEDAWGLRPDVTIPFDVGILYEIRRRSVEKERGIHMVPHETVEKTEGPVPNDPQLEEAIRILKDPDRYDSILAGASPAAERALPKTAKGVR